MEYLLRFMQVHETFRLAEIKSIAVLEGIDLEVISYNSNSPFCIIKLPTESSAKRLLCRSILSKAIYELWGQGNSYDSLHENVKAISKHLWPKYQSPTSSFKFTTDSFQGSRTSAHQREIINSFRYLAFQGPIRLKNPDQEFCIMEEWHLDDGKAQNPIRGVPGEGRLEKDPRTMFLGRFIAVSARDTIFKYDLKKRIYISTTSMDAELSLVTANITLASSGKLFYDPFVGTGSFPLAAAHFGATVFGSDIDGRSIRGKGEVGVQSNFVQYGLKDKFGDCFVADLTNSPLKGGRWLDGIVCDPPYGVREGLKVLGNKDPSKPREPVWQDGVPTYTLPDYIPPKKPYSFTAMLTQILAFASASLVPNARLSFWMPTANDNIDGIDEGGGGVERGTVKEIPVPTHYNLEVVSICTQEFNKWSRRLITYRRLEEWEVAETQRKGREEKGGKKEVIGGRTASELNPFRKMYFEGFRKEEVGSDSF